MFVAKELTSKNFEDFSDKQNEIINLIMVDFKSIPGIVQTIEYY